MIVWRFIPVNLSKKIERDTDRDNFMSAQEAKLYGLVDDVLVQR